MTPPAVLLLHDTTSEVLFYLSAMGQAWAELLDRSAPDPTNQGSNYGGPVGGPARIRNPLASWRRTAPWRKAGWSLRSLDVAGLFGHADWVFSKASELERKAHVAPSGAPGSANSSSSGSKGSLEGPSNLGSIPLGSSSGSEGVGFASCGYREAIVPWEAVCGPIASPWVADDERQVAESFLATFIRDWIAEPCRKGQDAARSLDGASDEAESGCDHESCAFVEGVLVSRFPRKLSVRPDSGARLDFRARQELHPGLDSRPLQDFHPRERAIGHLASMFWVFFLGPYGFGMYTAYAFPAGNRFAEELRTDLPLSYPQEDKSRSMAELEAIFGYMARLWQLARRDSLLGVQPSSYLGRARNAIWLGRAYRGKGAWSLLRAHWPSAGALDEEVAAGYFTVLLERSGVGNVAGPTSPNDASGLRRESRAEGGVGRLTIRVEWDQAQDAVKAGRRSWQRPFAFSRDYRDPQSFASVLARVNEWALDRREFMVWVRFSERWAEQWKRQRKRLGLDALSKVYRGGWPPIAPLPLSAVVKLWGVPGSFRKDPEVWWEVEERSTNRGSVFSVCFPASLGTVDAGSPEMLRDGRFGEELLENRFFYRIWEWWLTVAATAKYGLRRRNDVRARALASRELPALSSWYRTVNRTRTEPMAWFTYLLMPVLLPVTQRPGCGDLLWNFYCAVADEMPAELRHFLLSLVAGGTHSSVDNLLNLGVVYDREGNYLLLVVPEPLDLEGKRLYRKFVTGVRRGSARYFTRLLATENVRSRSYLVMRNPSTGLYHMEGVPPEIRTVSSALAWRAAGLGDADGYWAPAALS